jgi:hypothetical protein
MQTRGGLAIPDRLPPKQFSYKDRDFWVQADAEKNSS